DLVLMMGEDEIDSTRVNVEDIGAKPTLDQLQGHCGALDVPTRAPPAERSVPCRTHRFIFRLGRLPQNEVPRILLRVLVCGDALAGTGLELATIEPGETPVRREPRDRKIDRPILASVCDPLVEQALNQLDHWTDAFRRPGLLVRGTNPQPVTVFLEGTREGIDVGSERDALVPRGGDGSVIHV